MAKIREYIPIIKNKILPTMESNYGINFKSEPVLLRNTAVTYAGLDSTETRVMMEFNSEYQIKGKSLLNSNELFATVFYGFAGAKAGVIDLSNINETTEILYSTLYELGFRTSSDIDEEKAKAQQDKEKAEKEKEEKIKQAREKEKARHEAMFRNDNEKEEPEEEPQEEESEDYYTESVDNILKDFINKNEVNSSLHCTYLIPDSIKQNVFSVDVYYVSTAKCYIKSEYLELDKVYDTKDLEDFLIDLSTKYTPRVLSFYSANDELLSNYIM